MTSEKSIRTIGNWNVHVFGASDTGERNFRHLPVLLLHGFMQDAASWRAVSRALSSDGRTVVVPDMMPVSEDASSLEDYAFGVRDVIDWMLDAQPSRSHHVHIIAYSMGGRIALTLLGMMHDGGHGQDAHDKDIHGHDVHDKDIHGHDVQSHDIIASLVLESAGLGPETESDRTRYAERNERFAKRILQADSIEDVVDFWESLPIFKTQQTLPVRTRTGIRNARLSLAPFKQNLAWAVDRAGAQHMSLASENRAILVRSGIPICYVAGKSDQKYMAVAQSLEKTHAENVRVSYLAGGHDVHLENPDDYIACVQAFIRAHDASAE